MTTPASGLQETLDLPDLAATRRLARALAMRARRGDVIALEGDLGAGKTTLARFFIAALGVDEEVVSPTFSLVQRYALPDGGAPVWHFDFYRLSSDDEAFELGIEEAFAEGISLIEWPERLPGVLPDARLVLHLQHGADENQRRAVLSGQLGDCGAARLARDVALLSFLDNAGWGEAPVRPLAGDASFRSYCRVGRGMHTAIVMDAPPEHEDVRPFIAMADWLRGIGLSSPEILAGDPQSGFLLLEDLGDGLFARLIAAGRGQSKGPGEEALYRAATQVLAHLQRCPPPAGLPVHDEAVLLDGARLFAEWFLPAVTGAPAGDDLEASFIAAWRAALAALPALAPVVALRDYHAENLLWLDNRTGPARVGLLDFQDASLSSPAYDLVSLLQDARRDVAPALEAAMIEHFLSLRPELDPVDFRTAYALLGAQRNTRIIGVFTRLWRRDGKAGYLPLIPRVWGLLARDLAHPALAPLRAWFDHYCPPALRRAPLPEEKRQT
jgi:tRNA threonylcarbamoyl adenosine modification protein YjeE